MLRRVRLPVSYLVLLVPIGFCALYSSSWYRENCKKVFAKALDSELLPGKVAVLLLMVTSPVLVIALATAVFGQRASRPFLLLPLSAGMGCDVLVSFIWLLVQCGWVLTRIQRKAHFGTTLGLCAMVNLQAFLIPVSKMSPILNAIRMPPERALRFHKGLGWATLWMLAGHAGWYTREFASDGMLLGKLLSWEGHIPIFPGVLAFVSLLPLFATSSSYVRQRCSYETFLYTHRCCSLFFLVFVASHFPGILWWCFPSLLLYFVDRISQLHSWRSIVEVASYEMAAGVLTLTIPFCKQMARPEPFHWVHLQAPDVSYFQWHPFTVAGVSGNEYNVSMKIVPGGWTDMLAQQVQSTGSAKLRVGGPYGTAFSFEEYDNGAALLMFAGGSGGTPFTSLIGAMARRNGHDSICAPAQLVWVFHSEDTMVEYIKRTGLQSIACKVPALTVKLFVTSPSSENFHPQDSELELAVSVTDAKIEDGDPIEGVQGESGTKLVIVIGHIIVPVVVVIAMRCGLDMKMVFMNQAAYMMLGVAVSAVLTYALVFISELVIRTCHKRATSERTKLRRTAELVSVHGNMSLSPEEIDSELSNSNADPVSSTSKNREVVNKSYDAGKGCNWSVSFHSGRPDPLSIIKQFELCCASQRVESVVRDVIVLASGPASLLAAVSETAHACGHSFESISFSF